MSLIIKMIEQNKRAQGLSEVLGQVNQAVQESNAQGESVQKVVDVQENDQSRIQILLPIRKSQQQTNTQLLTPLNLISVQTHKTQQAEHPKQSSKQTPKPNLNDVSVVCIDLYSQNQTIQRKPTLNSLHFSRIFQELKKQQKLLIDQAIQTLPTSLYPPMQSPVQPKSKQVNSEQTLGETSTIKENKQKNQEMSPIEEQQNSQVIELPPKQSNKQTPPIAQIDSQIKQTAYLNPLQASLPQIRNRIVTFQALPQTNSNQEESYLNSSTKEINLPQNQNQHQAQVQDQETVKYLEGVHQNQYDRIIQNLTQKIKSLQLQYTQLVSQGELTQFEQQLFQDQLNINAQQIQPQKKNLKPSHPKLQIYKTYEISIPLPNLSPSLQSPKYPIQPDQIQYQDPSSTSKQVQVSERRSVQIKQFSSGDVSNLLAESETDLIDIKDLQQDRQQTPTNNLGKELSQIPVVFSQSLSPQNSLEIASSSVQLPVLVLSQSNLATVKQSYQELPFERFKTIMGLDLILSKISFKEKHFPSLYSTDKELKLYGKRLLRMLYEQSSNQFQQTNILTLQNDLQYYKSQQQVIYYLKSNQNFIIVCYFNRTIYIGEYITQGPIKDITRQGYGIQIRQSKYFYQGQFFADKKHGYGYVQFLGKNPFIYCGCFLDGFMDGYGKSMSPNGEIYLGDYKLGQRDGTGKLIYNQDKNAFYEGQFYDGFKHGKGFEIFQNGDSYKGSYSRDKFEGEGEYKWKNSTLYQGTFVEGSKHGPGLLIFANGQTFEKYYDHNKQINLEDDKKTIKSSRISAYSQNKLQEKTLIQEKPRNFRNTRSVSGQSLLSYKSRSNQKSVKLIKDKNKIAQLLKEKEIQEDLKNLDKILKDPTVDESKIRKIFSVKKLDTRDKIIGKMYNTTQRPAMKISEKGELDLIKLSKIGSQRKSLVNFDSEQKLQELRESSHHRRVQRTTNFSQF